MLVGGLERLFTFLYVSIPTDEVIVSREAGSTTNHLWILMVFCLWKSSMAIENPTSTGRGQGGQCVLAGPSQTGVIRGAWQGKKKWEEKDMMKAQQGGG